MIRKRIHTLVFFLLAMDVASAAESAQPAEATPARRSSSLRLGHQQSVGFQSSSLSARLGVTDQYQGTFSLSRSASEGLTPYASLDLGVNFPWQDDFHWDLRVSQSYEPNEVSSRGATAGLDWDLDSPWNEERTTSFSMSSAVLVYGSAARASRADKLQQSVRTVEFSLGVDQELNERWSISAGYSRVFFSTDPKKLARSVSNRRVIVPGIRGVISGFTRSSWNVGVDFAPVEAWRVSGSFSQSSSAEDGTLTGNTNLVVSWRMNRRWSVGLDLTRSRSAGSTPDGTAGADLSFFW